MMFVMCTWILFLLLIISVFLIYFTQTSLMELKQRLISSSNSKEIPCLRWIVFDFCASTSLECFLGFDFSSLFFIWLNMFTSLIAADIWCWSKRILSTPPWMCKLYASQLFHLFKITRVVHVQPCLLNGEIKVCSL